ncbi:MAG: transglutaminase-like domain-containing protein [Rhodospirillales bacterium]|nr:transglutaminase-like domain-containing protein [Rhodospirillales bacterium]
MTLSPKHRESIGRIGTQDDADIDLAVAALAIAAASRPGVSKEPYQRHLAKLTEDVSVFAGSSRQHLYIDDCIDAMTQVICRRNGYGCDPETYDEIDAANLMHVIDNRRGLPVVLGIIFIHVARNLGWQMDGVDFPSRFLVRFDHGGERRILDPSEGLVSLDPAALRALLKSVAGNEAELTPGACEPMSNRSILSRMQNNIKVRHLRAHRMEEALEVIETMALIAPEEPALWREAGIINAKLDNLKAAVAALEEYLRRDGMSEQGAEARDLLRQLRSRLN